MFTVEVSYKSQAECFTCSTRRDFLTKVTQAFGLSKKAIQLIDLDTMKHIEFNDVGDKMKLKIKTDTISNDSFEKERVKPPNFKELYERLKENKALTGLERQYLMENLHILEDRECTPKTNNGVAKQTSNKKVQVKPDVLPGCSQTMDVSFVSGTKRPSTSKDFIRESKRLASEGKKNLSKISEVMDSTFEERRNFIYKQNPVVLHVKEKYPLLFNFNEVHNELNRIFFDGKDTEFLSNISKYSSAILQIVDEEDPLLKNLHKKIDTLKSDQEKKYATDVGALLLLSNIFQESRIYISTEDEPIPKSNYPRIEVDCKVDKLFYDTQMYKIIVEEQLLCEAPDFREAIFCLMATFFIFNISYPEPAFNTFVVMEKILLEANDTDGNDIDDSVLQIMKLIKLKAKAQS